MSGAVRTFFADRALVGETWAEQVSLGIGADGRIETLDIGGRPPADYERLNGPVVPALGNLHSHAFQRAMAGLAETSGDGADSFWTWRDLMYRLVGRLTPDDVEAIAARLYADLIRSGYGGIAEFHYLHHDAGGAAYADPAELSARILNAASDAGIGLTLLPVFYAHSDFGGAAPTPGQARFLHDVDGYLSLLQTLRAKTQAAGATLGLAFHSLRAATPGEIAEILAGAPTSGPVHIHIAEQQREVEACLAHHGRRPVEQLFDSAAVDARWCLVHATHVSNAELAQIASSSAVAGLCPTTEANLGDGLFPASDFQTLGGRFGVGSDSHVSTSLAEELRWLEYGQRLRDQGRNRLAGGPSRSVGGALFRAAGAGGAQALGQSLGRIEIGATASLVVLDGDDPFIATAKGDAILDRWLFGLGDRAVRDVMVGGAWRVRDGRHLNEARIQAAFSRAITRLFA